MKKSPLLIVIGLILFGGIVYWSVRSGGDASEALTTPTPTPLVSVSVAPSVTPAKIIRNPKPTPGIIAKDVVSHQQLVDSLDPLNRRLALDADCTSVVPSQVAYPNDLEIMIDNYDSNVARILKIGGREYSIDAHAWIFTTLHSNELPARLPIFCGAMELGAIDLVAK